MSDAQQLVTSLAHCIGFDLTRVVSDARFISEVHAWYNGDKEPTPRQLENIQFTLDVFERIEASKDAGEALLWLVGKSIPPDDSAPADAIRTGNLEAAKISATRLINDE